MSVVPSPKVITAHRREPNIIGNSPTVTLRINSIAYHNLSVVPIISTVLPNSGITGIILPILTITGTGFAVGATVNFGGTSYPATVNLSTQLTVSNVVVAGMAGPVSVTVTNPGLAGATSAASIFVAQSPFAGTVEDFETGTKNTYASESVTLATGSWTLSDALIANVGGSDLGNGGRTLRLKEKGTLVMGFEKLNGAATITLKAAAYGNDATASRFASFEVEVFNNGITTDPATYSSGPITVTSSLQTYTFAANVSGSIKVRITNQNENADFRINIDDVTISSNDNQLPNTYVWTGLGNNTGWSDPANWSPMLLTPAGTDIFVFDGNAVSMATVALDFAAAGHTIGQLQLRNSVRVNILNTGYARTLNLDGAVAGDDLTIEAGSSLTMRGTNEGAVILNVTAGETALVNGHINSETANGGAANRLTGQMPGAIRFGAGSGFTAELGVTGSPFGNTVANKQTVVFRAGATFRQVGGGNAFGLTQPAAAAVFESGSVYQFAVPGSSMPSVSGRTFGTLELLSNNSSLENITGNAPLLIQNDLHVGNSVKAGLNLSGGIRIGGNIGVAATGELAFDPLSANVLSFDGNQQQVLTGSSFIRFGTQTTLTINNAASVRLQIPIRINGKLNLQNGVLISSAANLPTLAAAADVVGGSSTSYVSGPVARQLPAATTRPQVFPVGKAGNYRPFTLRPTQLHTETLVTVEQQEGQPAPIVFNDNLKRVSQIRRYLVSASPALSATEFEGLATLSFDPNDRVNNPAAGSFVIARTDADGLAWNSLGRSASPPISPNIAFVSGELTSGSFVGLNVSGIYALASTEPDIKVNPLPVQLLSLDVQWQNPAVHIRWTTAAELNNLSFEVQRSATGQDFKTIATVVGQGTTTDSHAYWAFDHQPLPSISYYRLCQLDTNGKQAFSTIVSVAAPIMIRTYPNPVHTQMTVVLPVAGAYYRIISLVGNTQLAGTIPATTAQLDMAALPTGLYQLEITTPAGRDVRKIIKQ